MPFKGQVTRSEIWFLLGVFIGLILTLVIGITLGAIVNYGITLGISMVFILALVIIFICLKKRNGKLLIYAHLALALYARCENNRFYLRRKVLIRPGHMAKWIEFDTLRTVNNSTMETM